MIRRWLTRIAARKLSRLDRGDAFGPRFRASRRATLRCLALSASIAIAGCHGRASPIPDWRDDELKPSTYRFLAATADETERPLLRRFMADGKITYGELAELNDFNESRASPLDDVKRELAQ